MRRIRLSTRHIKAGFSPAVGELEAIGGVGGAMNSSSVFEANARNLPSGAGSFTHNADPAAHQG